MVSETKGGEHLTFWMTRSMCRKLVGELCRQIQRRVDDRSTTDKGLILSTEQSVAVSRYQPAEPVDFRDIPEQRLVEKIDCRVSSRGIGIRFPLDKGHSADIQMFMTDVRQWLDMFYQIFRNADWGLDIWPAWMTGKRMMKN